MNKLTYSRPPKNDIAGAAAYLRSRAKNPQQIDEAVDAAWMRRDARMSAFFLALRSADTFSKVLLKQGLDSGYAAEVDKVRTGKRDADDHKHVYSTGVLIPTKTNAVAPEDTPVSGIYFSVEARSGSVILPGLWRGKQVPSSANIQQHVMAGDRTAAAYPEPLIAEGYNEFQVGLSEHEQRYLVRDNREQKRDASYFVAAVALEAGTLAMQNAAR